MHNRLIFRYHQSSAHSKSLLLRGCPPFGVYEPTHFEEESNEGTQEGR
jgi:hypothetical protein